MGKSARGTGKGENVYAYQKPIKKEQLLKKKKRGGGVSLRPMKNDEKLLGEGHEAGAWNLQRRKREQSEFILGGARVHEEANVREKASQSSYLVHVAKENQENIYGGKKAQLTVGQRKCGVESAGGGAYT